MSTPAAAKETGPKLLGTYGYWRAYQTTEGSDTVCYMTLTAHFPKNAKSRRADALLTITHRPIENSTDVISYAAGYNYKAASSADLKIGKQSFNLFTAQDTAWSRDAATDHKIAAAIIANSSVIISGTPIKAGAGLVTDQFSLKGAPEAYRAIGKACGLEMHEKTAPAKVKKKQ